MMHAMAYQCYVTEELKELSHVIQGIKHFLSTFEPELSKQRA